MGNLTKKGKKALAGALIRVSVLSTTVVPTVGSPVSVEAAVKASKPVIVTKANTFNFGVNSAVGMSNFVKSIKKGSSKIKSVKFVVPKGAVKVSCVEKNPTMWAFNEVTMLKKGTHTVKIVVTDTKGVTATKSVKVKVGDSLSKHVTIGSALKIKKGTNGLKVDYMKGVKYDKKYVKSIIPGVYSDSGFPTKKKGTFKLDYVVYGKSGEVLTIKRTVKVV